ncbi:MAG: hypothetical protein JO342_16335 [Solirubrobacterales bacterium]|nr:hypothetical protein [Solirubrobacterales bacterium]
MTQGLGSGWAGLVDEFKRELRLLDPPGELLSTEIDAVGLLRFRVRLDPPARAHGKVLVRAYEARAAQLCEECGGAGRVRSGLIITVLCDDCVAGSHNG